MKNPNSFITFCQTYKFEISFLALAFISTLVSGVLFLSPVKAAPRERSELPSVKTTVSPTEEKIVVDISGSVNKPDSYELKPGARLKDLLVLADGLSEKADKEFFNRNYNLARLLLDQDKIHIPSREETNQGIYREKNKMVDYTKGVKELPDDPSLINLNTASIDALMQIDGVTKTIANKIVAARPISTIDELITKKVMKQSVLDKIKNQIEL